MSEKLKPWERQEGEGPERWEGFLAYRDYGLTRSLAKAAQAVGKSATLIGTWSVENSWLKRVEAWDRDQDRIRLAAQERGLAKAVEKAFSEKEFTREWVLGRMKKIADIALAPDEEGNIVPENVNFYGAIRPVELIGREIGMFKERDNNAQVTNNYAIFLNALDSVGPKNETDAIEVEMEVGGN
jgi:hypothetical protein